MSIKNKKILYFGFNNHYGGAQRSMAEIFGRISDEVKVYVVDAYGVCKPYEDAIRSSGCEYSVLYPDAGETAIVYQGTNKLNRLMSSLSAIPSLVKIIIRLRNELCRIKPDLVIISGYKSLHILEAARGFRNLPIIYYLRGNYLSEQLNCTTRFMFRHFVNRFIAVSTVTRDNVCDIGVKPEKIEVLFNPVDIDRVNIKAGSNPSPKLPVEEAPIRILLPATFIPAKGQLCAIRALHRLVNKNYDAVLWMAGDIPPNASSNYLEELKAEIHRLNLEQRAFILSWRDDILAVMSRATVVLLPSHTEGMPRTVLEAMALNKPVAATPVGGIVDIIKDGETGLLFEVEDDKAAALAIEKLNERNLADRMAGNAQQFVRTHCSIQSHRERILEIVSNCTK